MGNAQDGEDPRFAERLRRFDQEWLGLFHGQAISPEPSEPSAAEIERAGVSEAAPVTTHFPLPPAAHVEAAYANSLNPDVVPLHLVVQAHHLEDFAALTTFERALANIDEVVDTRVDWFDDETADVEVTLSRPVALGYQLRAIYGFEVDDHDPRRIVVQLAGHVSW